MRWGELIEARVYGDVVQKGKIVIPNGSLVRAEFEGLSDTEGNRVQTSSWDLSSRKWK
jgi:hypothetical protein